MDQGLFAKHIHTVLTRNSKKQEIISFLLEKTGIQVNEEEFTLSKKKISFTTSSVKKTALIQKGTEALLQSLGYSLSL